MSCNDKHHHHHDSNCVCEIVKYIDDIQKAHEDYVGCPTNCLNPVLGATHHHGNKPNTRVISLYTKTGELFFGHFFDHKFCDTKSSEFFRVESVEDCCAVLRVLDVDRKNVGICEFDRTNQCIVVDLKCFCGIACIEDTYIPGV